MTTEDPCERCLSCPDVLTLILPWLGMRHMLSCAIVCKAWHLAASDVISAWRSLDHESCSTCKGHPCFMSVLPGGQQMLISEAAGCSAAHLRLVDVASLETRGVFGGRSGSKLKLARPTGIATSKDGVVFVADSELGSVQRFTLSRGREDNCTTIAVPKGGALTQGASNRESWSPYGLALVTIDGEQVLFVSDSRFHRILGVRMCGTPSEESAI